MNLKNVTYLSFVPNESDKKCQDIDSIVRIGINSSKDLNFGKKIIYTYKEPTINTKDFEIKIVDEIPYDDFGNVIYDFYAESFDTDFVINFHSDGFIQNPKAWTDDFLNYDYIGAPIYTTNTFPFVGNGGFSLRSKKICEKVKKLKDINYLPRYLDCFKGNFISEDFYENLPLNFKNEDVYIGLFCKDILDSYGFKFADLNTASKFSTEHIAFVNNSPTKNPNVYDNSFGFHEIEKLFNEPLKIKRRKIQETLNNEP